MTIKLRAHHFLCILTYVGKGYSSSFIHNYDRVIQGIKHERVTLVEGPDDICQPLLVDCQAHCFTQRVIERDKIAKQELSAVLSIDLSIGATFYMTPDILKALRDAFTQKRIRSACVGCEWSNLCDDVALSGYVNTRLK